MVFQFNNLTNGAYSDDQIYWAAIGKDPFTHEICYVDAKGDMHPAKESMNDITLDSGRKAASCIINRVSENKYVYMPSIESGRMYISYGKPIYIAFNTDVNGKTGFAGPDMNNTTDPNANTYFEFMEFTIGMYNGDVPEPTHYWGNTTRVDNFCFPIVSRLIGENRTYDGQGNVVHSEPYNHTVGDLGTRNSIFSDFINGAPAEFKSGCTDNYRIFAPCKRTFDKGQVNANFFQPAIDAFWQKYENEPLTVNCEGGTFVCRTNGNGLDFTTEVWRQQVQGHIDKPSTQAVLEGRDAFDRRTNPFAPADSIEFAIGSKELVLEAQLCAAFNRGVIMNDPADWYDVSKYYQNYEPYKYNYYSKFWHEHAIGAKGYGFCYDDVNDQSTLLECNTAHKLVMDLKWN